MTKLGGKSSGGIGEETVSTLIFLLLNHLTSRGGIASTPRLVSRSKQT
jgi:hypothetical protein